MFGSSIIISCGTPMQTSGRSSSFHGRPRRLRRPPPVRAPGTAAVLTHSRWGACTHYEWKRG